MKITTGRRPGLVRRCVAIGATAAVLGTGALLGDGLTAAALAAAPPAGVILGVGADESQRVVSWYTSTDAPQVVQVVAAHKVKKGVFPWGTATYTATVTANSVNGGYNGHATISGLKQNTTYFYRVGSEGTWSPTYSFKTQTFNGSSPFNFLFFGDPQIGSSGDVAGDGAGWRDTLDVVLKANPNTELLVSGGDQVEHANTEAEWDSFLSSDYLRQYPWAATIGNHDVGGKAYEQHLWTPNTDRSAAYYQGNTSTQSGGDYWFVYRDVLFIDINSNAYANGADDAHIGYVSDVINKHGRDAKYTVLVYHHSIYSPADHANDGDNKVRRVDFPTAFSNLGVDLVLQGHDHSYSRSYEIKNGAKQNANEQPGASRVVQGPGGVIYVTANSASGSKYYDLTTPVEGEYGPDPLNPESHWANSVENQEHVRTYVKVTVTNNQLVVENIRSGTCEAPNSAVEHGRVLWCGPDEGTATAKPVGSIVDKVAINVPGGKPGFPGGKPAPTFPIWSHGPFGPGKPVVWSHGGSTRVTRLF